MNESKPPTRCEKHGVLLDATDCCPLCGVYHRDFGGPCPDCGRYGYHRDDCPTLERRVASTRCIRMSGGPVRW